MATDDKTTNPDAGSDCLGFATAGRVAPSDPAKGRGKTTPSQFLREKIAHVQVYVWAQMPPGKDKDAVAAICDGLLDALDEKDAAHV